jgi:hypothetical protein
MRPPADSDHLVELSPEQCFELLHRVQVGRVVLVAGERPVALPLNYACLAHSVVFATGPGVVLEAALRGDTLSFEVDQLDDLRHEAWSVLVSGRPEVLEDSALLARMAGLELTPWVGVDHPVMVRIPGSSVTGRRIRHAAPRYYVARREGAPG